MKKQRLNRPTCLLISIAPDLVASAPHYGSDWIVYMRTTIAALGAILIAAASSDVNAAAVLTRHPYPQNVQTNQVTLMWRTATPAQQTIQWGSDSNFTSFVTESAPSTAHEMTITGLAPGQVYRYRIVENNEVVIEGNDYTFRTDAGRGDTDFSFFITGDVGEDEQGQQHVTQAMIRRVSPRAEFGILPGDIVYPDGESSMYDSVLMKPWKPLLTNTPVWPALGNHDWHVDPDQNFCKEWALPNNEHYYSFNYANAHFIALDTADGFLYDQANQLAWLRADLASWEARQATWTFVYYHHPLLTCTYKSNIPEVAALLFPIFDEFNVDAVFTGHAHTYERLFPLKNGVPVNQAQNPNYQDPEGTLFVVSGCGAKIKMNEPTTYCGPTAAFVDRRLLFTQAFIYDHLLYILTFDSVSGAVVDYVSITKTPQPSDVTAAPAVPRLYQNVPNPFNPSTSISFELPEAGHVRMRVFRADGSFVTNLVDRAFGTGTHRVAWDGRDQNGAAVASGPYIVRLQADGIAESIKMMLVR